MAALMTLCEPRAAVAQFIHGWVHDVTSEQPLLAVKVAVIGADGIPRAFTLTDSAGTFRLHAPANDTFRLRVERLGYATTMSVPLTLAASDSLRLEIRLKPMPLRLEGITATAKSRLNRNFDEFLRRQKNGFGRYAGPQEIARLRASSVTQVLWPLSGRLVPYGHGVRALRIPPAGPNAYCYPRVYVDGTPLPASGDSIAAPIDLDISPESLRAVEVYDNPHQAPAQFQVPFMEDCPVIVIWTDFGFGLPARASERPTPD
jgi:hypothetical protein